MATACSDTASMVALGELKTVTPRRSHAARSIWFVPVLSAMTHFLPGVSVCTKQRLD